jgi:hypothetical protein
MHLVIFIVFGMSGLGDRYTPRERQAASWGSMMVPKPAPLTMRHDRASGQWIGVSREFLAKIPLLAAAGLFFGHNDAFAQRVDGIGVTAPGDNLRGRGQFLRGMAWYELGTARANAIQAEAVFEWNRAVRADYEGYLNARANHLATRRSLSNEREADAIERMKQVRRRWREQPTTDDVRSGNALNALASDLAAPSITVDHWRSVPVALPPEITIQALSFRFTDASGRKFKGSGLPSLVALGRMKGEHWPISLRRPDLDPERAHYKRAVTRVTELCVQKKPVQARDFEYVRDALDALRSKVVATVPMSGGQQKQAIAHLDLIDRATRFLLDHEIAEELIRDVEMHRAKTVGELLAFMKKYRLLFAEAEENPDVWSVYKSLYDLLSEQKMALDAVKRTHEAAPGLQNDLRENSQRSP